MLDLAQHLTLLDPPPTAIVPISIPDYDATFDANFVEEACRVLCERNLSHIILSGEETLEVLSDDDLRTLGLMRIPA